MSLGLMMLIVLLSACGNNENVHENDKVDKNGKIRIIEYGDYKCPYCKKVENKIMPKLKRQYIDKGKVDYQFVNMAFLGKDSIIGSRAGHAVQSIVPKEYLTFQRLMFEQQPDNEKAWITTKLVDKQIDKLNIDNQTKVKIKDDYKKKNSKSWEAAKKDRQQYKKNHIDTAPTIYVKGEKLKDPYKFSSYEKLLTD